MDSSIQCDEHSKVTKILSIIFITDRVSLRPLNFLTGRCSKFCSICAQDQAVAAPTTSQLQQAQIAASVLQA
ncbi:hypothetical protein EV2_024946 [Malus domestica]